MHDTAIHEFHFDLLRQPLTGQANYANLLECLECSLATIEIKGTMSYN